MKLQYYSVEITRHALNAMLEDAHRYPRVETGGRLAGSIDAARGVLVITHATPSGPYALRERHLFHSDARHDQQQLNAIVQATGGASDYVGEWHRHCRFNTSPSPQDRAMLRAIGQSEQYGTPQPCLFILGLPDEMDSLLYQYAAHCWGGDELLRLPVEIDN